MATIGLPIWQTDVWDDGVWAAGVWEFSGGMFNPIWAADCNVVLIPHG